MVTPESLIGKQIDQFRIERFLARGAMGMVFKAFDAVLTRTVALKVIPKGVGDAGADSESFSREEARKRLIQEAKAAGRLSHPNIVTIHCYGETEELQYICMEYVEGKTLSQLLGERGALPEEEVIPILMQVLAALEAASRENIIHRDIKPSNIMLTHDNRVKVMDFGIAKLPSLSMTVTGMVLGTPFYMSPEQISGQKVDIRSDIFSTGAVLYELLTGQKPFPGDSTATLTYKILQMNPAPPTTINAQISPPMSAITLRALAKDPAERFQTPAEMLTAMRKHQEKLSAQSADGSGATIVGSGHDGYEATVLADRPKADVASAPQVEVVRESEPSEPQAPPGKPDATPPKEPPKRMRAEEEEVPRGEPERETQEPAGRKSPEKAEKGGTEAARATPASRAVGVAALLLLVLAAAFVLYVSVRAPEQPPAPADTPKPPVAPSGLPPSPPQTVPAPTVSAPPATPARSLESLLLEAGRNFVSNPATAQKLLEEALTINPGHFESLMMLARLSSYQKDYAGAIQQYEAALRVNSQATEAYFELGCLQVAQADYAAAVRSLEACLALQPRNRDDVLTNLGFAYSKLNNPEQASRLYQEALVFNPKNERARALMASLPQQPQPSQQPLRSGPTAQPQVPDQPKPAPPRIEGKYAVEGVNPNGSKYHGVATIARRDNRYTMTWSIGSQPFSGTGSLTGSTLTITWKSATGEGGIVTYTVTSGGALKGVWANGKGSETLTPLK
ncbi:MAG: protein kinase [Syntrophobacteraceae bacterium]